MGLILIHRWNKLVVKRFLNKNCENHAFDDDFINTQAPHFEESAIAGFLYKEISGEIGSSSFYYKKIEEGKNFYLILESTTGDTDLYISYKNYPLVQTASHDYSSYSCGVEQIPLENKRPVFIGVYCYSQYENCTFRLEIYKTNIDLSAQSNRHSVERVKTDSESDSLNNFE
uniref:CSON009666 protein n=1 Tax=Culicoides sonorensis TaxID=179676 RepID=A0A336M0R8_CULSO